MSPEQKHTITGRDRSLAHLALATVDDTVAPCPDPEEIALLVDGRVAESRQEELWHHLASCPICYEGWRVAAEVRKETGKTRSFSRVIVLGGGFLAAAASIMLFVNMQYSSVPEELFMDSPSVQNVEIGTVVGADEQLSPASSAPFFEENSSKRTKSTSQFTMQSAPRLLKASPHEDVLMEGVGGEDSFGVLDQKGEGEILLDINRLIPTVVQKIKQAALGDVIEVRTYKRDRGFTVERRTDGQVVLHEFGFKEQECIVAASKLKKILKSIIQKEFPRSNKVWLRVVLAKKE